MELKNLQEKENLLFKRKEISAKIESEITPTITEAEKLLSEKFSTDIEEIKIKKIKGKFGAKTFNVEANIYASKEDKDKTEIKSKKERAAAKSAKESKSETDNQQTPNSELTNKENSEPEGGAN